MLYYLGTLSEENIIPFVLAFILSMILAISVHEYMHARVAYIFGDDTAKLSGRMTLNPLAHISPLGLLCFILIGYGWANPVPVNPLRFKNNRYRLGLTMVSVAGVLANITMAFIFTGIFIFLLYTEVLVAENVFSLFMLDFLPITISMNLSLFFFNLIPIPPLDGFNLLNTLFYNSKIVANLRRYGFQIFLGILIIVNIFDINIIGFFAGFVESAFVRFWSSLII